jgi:glycosidase
MADSVPLDFWNNLRAELDGIKPVFMLAEAENPLLQREAFDMNYSWSMHHLMNQIAQRKACVPQLIDYYKKEDSIYSKDCYRMQFITNHDENSWNGTEFERMGDAVKTFSVMSFTIPGMPLIYTGQEVGLNKRLKFFEKDQVDYTKNEYPAFYSSLTSLKKNNPVFWNGEAGGDFKILNAANDSIFAFKRYNDSTEVFVLLNLSKNQQHFEVPKGMAGAYTDYFKGESAVMNEGEESTLNPWEYKVYLVK